MTRREIEQTQDWAEPAPRMRRQDGRWGLGGETRWRTWGDKLRDSEGTSWGTWGRARRDCKVGTVIRGGPIAMRCIPMAQVLQCTAVQRRGIWKTIRDWATMWASWSCIGWRVKFRLHWIWTLPDSTLQRYLTRKTQLAPAPHIALTPATHSG